MTDLASEAAAVTAGWIKLQIDRGAGKSPRFITEQSKPITGDPDGGSGANVVGGRGESDASAAAADTAALASLNKWRALRYGQDATVSKGKRATTAHTVDVT
jgi:hypothetical protein